MNRRLWILLSLSAAGAVGAFAGCGSDASEGVFVEDAGDGSTGPADSTTGEDVTGTNDATGGGDSAGDGAKTSDGGADGEAGSLLDGQTCLLVGQACGLDTDCCTRICNKAPGAAVGECASQASLDGGTGCKAAGASCTSGPECCTNSCISNQCSATLCKADTPAAESCTSNAECCSGNCDVGATNKCVPLAGGTCRTEGNPCTLNSDCCSRQCDANKRCNNASFCQQTGDVCANDFECCGGSCDKASGATLGRCSTVGSAACSPAGTLCTGAGCNNLCCSLSCGPLGATGVNICQPPSGCRPQNELCQANEDCCGGPGRPGGLNPDGTPTSPLSCVVESGDTLGRCPFAQCLRPGAVCFVQGNNCGGTSNNCCRGVLPDGGVPLPSFCNSNPEACCSLDALGIPRCRAVNFVCADGGTVPAGQLCATSADCCGKPCVNNKCEGSCVPKGGECTINADCCSPETCVVPTGSTKGICGGTITSDGGVQPPPDSGTTDSGTTDSGTTDSGGCAQYGQACTSSGQCCSGVPCTSGTCRYP